MKLNVFEAAEGEAVSFEIAAVDAAVPDTKVRYQTPSNRHFEMLHLQLKDLR